MNAQSVIAATFVWLISNTAVGQSLAPNAPADRPFTAKPEQVQAFESAIAPYVEKAKATYPSARKKYLDGLPAGQSFFVTTRLRDRSEAFEQVFIAVTNISDGIIAGKIASDIQTVSGYRLGQAYSFSESDLLDWLISMPDGSEEGNFVGKFLDTYRP